MKEQHKPIAPNNMRKSVLDSENETVQKLLSDIVAVYGNRENNAHYGTFLATGARGDFPSHYETYADHGHAAAIDDSHFMGLAKCAMDELYRTANAQPASSGGYIFVADYSLSEKRYLIIAMIKQKPGMTINQALDPQELMRLDLDRLHQAARINFTKYFEYKSANDAEERKEINYLTFISPSKEIKTSGYFITALGCSAGNTSSRATKAVIQETTAFFKSTEGLRCNSDAFRKALMEYLSEKEEKHQSVKLSEIGMLISKHIPTELADNSEALLDQIIKKLNDEEVGVPAEFPVSKTELKKHTHISGRAAHWRVEFDRDALGSTDAAPIYYNEEQGTITFKDIPPELQIVIEHELSQRK